MAGTDPASPAQVLRLALRPGNDGENLRLEFRHAPSRRYELQVSGDLRTWPTLDSIAPTYAVGTGWAGFDVAGKIASEARFFRVRAGRASATTPTP